MKNLSREITHFFQNQNFSIVSTIDKNGRVHNSCKGIVEIDKNGTVYLLDLYKRRTFANLKQNPNISITAVDEYRFKGFCLKGEAKILELSKFKIDVFEAWENRLTSRITQRVIKNIQGKRGHSQHPEVLFPKPKYLIGVEIKEIVNLSPIQLRR
jgi:general stress protein 26